MTREFIFSKVSIISSETRNLSVIFYLGKVLSMEWWITHSSCIM